MDDFLQAARIACRRHYGLVLDPAYENYRPPAPDEAFFRQASHHRLIGLFAAEWFPEWQSRAYGQAYYTANCTAVAERIYVQLRDMLPDVGLIKGPALALQAWPQPGLRSFDDLDFRCAWVPYDRLRDAFAACGYKPDQSPDARNAHRWHFGWGVTFVHPEDPLVECNHRLFPPHFPWPSRVEHAVRSCWHMQKLDQVSVRIPDPGLHLLYCCMHALWHGWDRLAWLVDIVGLLVRYPGSLDQARRLAGQHGLLRKALEAGCMRSNAWVGPLPGFLAVNSDVPPFLPTASVQDAGILTPGMLREEHLRYMNRLERLRYTAGRILTPGDPDFQWCSLPARFHAMYWLLRPVRIATKLRMPLC